MDYMYLGDKATAPENKIIPCSAVRREGGKCIRGKNGSMLVVTETGKNMVVIGRLLRKIKR